MAYTIDDFNKSVQTNGLKREQFSDYDWNLAQKYPEFGISMSNLKRNWLDATTDEQKLLANETANKLRQSYGNYTGGADGSKYVSSGLQEQLMDDTAEKIRNYGDFSYGDFSYDPYSDQRYASYRKQYLREGDRATQNALATAASATQGRPSSWAVNAATQAGDYYAAKAADIIPTLYQQELERYQADRNFAYNQWQDGYNRLLGEAEMYRDKDATEYQRALAEQQYRDQMENQAYTRAWNENQRDYERNQYAQQYADSLAAAQAQAQAQAEQQARDNQLAWYKAETDYQKMLNDYALGQAGAETDYQKMLNDYALGQASAETARQKMLNDYALGQASAQTDYQKMLNDYALGQAGAETAYQKMLNDYALGQLNAQNDANKAYYDYSAKMAGYQNELDRLDRELMIANANNASKEAIAKLEKERAETVSRMESDAKKYVADAEAEAKKSVAETEAAAKKTTAESGGTEFDKAVDSAKSYMSMYGDTDDVIESMLDAGYTENVIEQAGYSGDYFETGTGQNGELRTTNRMRNGLVEIKGRDYNLNDIIDEMEAGKASGEGKFTWKLSNGKWTFGLSGK